MTAKEFNNLKVGNFIPINVWDGLVGFGMCQIIEINRTTKRIKVVGKNKEYHFSKVKSAVPQKEILYGTCGLASPYHIVEKLECPKPL